MRFTKKQIEIINTVKANYRLLYDPMLPEWKEAVQVVTIDFLEACGLHFTTNHTGKMSGMISLSTTCKCGTLCPARIATAYTEHGLICGDKKALKKLLKADPYRTDVSICGFCFSDNQQNMFGNMINPLSKNFEILNNGIIHKDWVPVVNALYFRGESFGDFASVAAVVNFFNIARKNPAVNFTAWTKNPGYFLQAVNAGNKKPKNFKLVLSSQFINRPAVITPAIENIINAVFTVYTPEYAERYAIEINCGARSCLACLRCYKGYKSGNVKIVNELLK